MPITEKRFARLILAPPLAVALALAGCTVPDRHAFGVRTSVGPLDEAEFDHYATSLAYLIRGAIGREGGRFPVQIAAPIVTRAGLETKPDADAFAVALAAGLSDRLEGAVTFAPPGAAVPWSSTIEFIAAPNDPYTRLAVFRLFDNQQREELFAEAVLYKLAKPRTVAAAADYALAGFVGEPDGVHDHLSPAPRPVRITDPAPHFVRRLHDEAWDYRSQTQSATDGKLIYLSKAAQRAAKLVSQRAIADPTTNRLLRLELELRAANRPTDTVVRVAFLDEFENQLEITPAIPYRLLPAYTKTVVIRPETKVARRYLVLLDLD